MSDQYQYAPMAHTNQTAGYPQFQYPTGGGDAHFLQGYSFPQQANVAMLSGQSNLGPRMQMHAGLGGNFPYNDYSQLNQYSSPMGAVGGITHSLNDMQQFNQLFPGAFNQSVAGNIFEALAQEQGLSGFNASAFLQDPTGGINRGFGGFPGKGFNLNQRGGMNKFSNGDRSNSLPSVTNPDGLREDTVFVSRLPQNVDHEVMKSHFGVIGKIKVNTKTGMPMIWIFKERGIPKGDALVTYEDSSSVQSAIKWFSENEFLGKKIEVKQAKNSQRPIIISPGGGVGGGANMMNLAAAAVAAAASGNTMSSLMNNSVAAAANLAALTGGAYGLEKPEMGLYAQMGVGLDGRNAGRSGNIPASGNISGGDWSCPNCNNFCLAWRDRCSQCSTPRPDDANPNVGMVGIGHGGCPPGMLPGRHGAAGAISGIPVIGSSGASGMGRCNPGGNMQLNTQNVGQMSQQLRGGGSGRGGGGGPMRGSGVTGGRMRPAPY